VINPHFFAVARRTDAAVCQEDHCWANKIYRSDKKTEQEIDDSNCTLKANVFGKKIIHIPKNLLCVFGTPDVLQS
jgi:hypothetical protein